MSLFQQYRPLKDTYDELFTAEARPRPEFEHTVEVLGASTPAECAFNQGLAEKALFNQGVTFSVYSDNRGSEKIRMPSTITIGLGSTSLVSTMRV